MCEAGTFVSIEDAARMLETTGMRVLLMLKRNEIKGKLDGETWQVEMASLQLCGKPKPADIVRKGGCSGGCAGGCH